MRIHGKLFFSFVARSLNSFSFFMSKRAADLSQFIKSAHLQCCSVFPRERVDIGFPQLAMHSAFETAGAKDVEYMVEYLKGFYAFK